MFHLRSLVCSKYTLSIELVLHRFGQSNDEKTKRNLGTLNRWLYIVPKTCFEGLIGDIVRTSWGRLESASQGRLLDVPRTSFRNVPSPSDWDIPRTSDQDVPGIVKQDLYGTSCGRWKGTSSRRPGDQYISARNLLYITIYFSSIQLWNELT